MADRDLGDRGFTESWLEAARGILVGDAETLSPQVDSALAATADAIRLVLRFDSGPRIGHVEVADAIDEPSK